eukprot:365415-Chlamydomonas_euryale.AAC.1
MHPYISNGHSPPPPVPSPTFATSSPPPRFHPHLCQLHPQLLDVLVRVGALVTEQRAGALVRPQQHV